MTARMCLRLDLIDGNVLFVDGTKIRANASRCRTHNQVFYQKRLAEIDQRIDQLLVDLETADNLEAEAGGLTAMNPELADARKLKNRIEGVLREFEATGATAVNQTDLDCRIMHSVQGSHAAYHVQVVTDDKHGLIANIDAVKDANDLNQLAVQIEQAREGLEKKCKIACADGGYADTEELEKLDGQGVKVIVPSQRQALHGEEKPFAKSRFAYDAEQDCYRCPEGHTLGRNGTDSKTGKIHYQIEKTGICHACPRFGTCTSAKKGRKIVRLPDEDLKRKFEAQYSRHLS